jgi:ribosome biogenesis GTPase / thiamine phosphate phosphatase
VQGQASVALPHACYSRFVEGTIGTSELFPLLVAFSPACGEDATRAQLELEDLGWTPALAAAFQPFANTGRPGRVAAVHNNTYHVLDGQADRTAVLAGHRRHRAGVPTVGDWVVLDPADADPTVIAAILPRATCLQRKAPGRTSEAQALAANVDLVVIVMGLDGDFNLRRLERTLVLVEQSRARALVVLNKADLGSDVAKRRREVEAVANGVDVHFVSARHGDGIDALTPLLTRGKTLVLLGSSGAGKSTLANRLGAAEQATAEVRAHDSRGQHTTTTRQMLMLPGGAWLIDTPGIREIQLLSDGEAVERVFDDVAVLAAGCRFRDCRHLEEPGCTVQKAIAEGRLTAERLQSLRGLRTEMRDQAERGDGTQQRERRAGLKAIHKAQKKNRSED